MLSRIALVCAALLAMGIAFAPVQASAHGWRAHHYGWKCHRCYRPVRWTCRRCYRPCYRRYWPEDPAAHLVRPLVPVTYYRPYWGFWGRWWW